MLSLKAAFRFSKSPQIAFVGAGGKTTAMYSLSHQLEPPVIVTSTTHLGSWQLVHADNVRIVDHADNNSIAEKITPDDRVVLLLGQLGEDDRYAGLDVQMMMKIHIIAEEMQIPLLIEADGSRMRPLKAPAEYEPNIPDFVDHVVVVAGMSALSKPLSEKIVHRAEVFSNLSSILPGEVITPGAVKEVLCNEAGGLKSIPDRARKILLLNQVSLGMKNQIMQEIALPALVHYDSVILASLSPISFPVPDTNDEVHYGHEKRDELFSVHERVAGIILAAGGSQRYGQLKQMLSWHGEPLIRTVAATALASGLSDVIVVLGADADEIFPVLQDLPVRVLINPDWSEGQSTSIRMGIHALGDRVNAAIFLLADQPFISSDLIRALVSEHNNSLAPIIAPVVNDQRGNPVLFDRITFPKLCELSGNDGGRSIFRHYSPHYIHWHDPKILLDIDTPEDYRQLRDHWDDYV